MKRQSSKSAFTNRPKKARVEPANPSPPSPGPSRADEQQIQVGLGSSVPVNDDTISAIGISPTMTTSESRLPSLELPLRVKKFMERSGSKGCSVLHTLVASHYCDFHTSGTGDPQDTGIVTLDVFMKNVTSKKASDFHQLVNDAVTEEDWKNVITHGMHLALS
jgi:hypothetical protein